MTTSFSNLTGLRSALRGSLAIAALLTMAACSGTPPAEITFQVVADFPHDTASYTQGLLVDGRVLVESNGRYGRSNLRRIDIQSGEVLTEVQLDSAHFAEGLALHDGELFQLTWREGLVFVRDAETLDSLRTHRYEGEGWGLCSDGTSLWMSNGGDRLVRRDPATFQALDTLQVTSSGISVFQLNELECVGEHIWANVYQANRIIKIDRASGRVIGQLDATSLAIQTPRPNDSGAVLNGIAYIAETDTFLLTGKLWSRVWAVRMTQ